MTQPIFCLRKQENFPSQLTPIVNSKIEEQFSSVYSIKLNSGLASYTIDPAIQDRQKLLWNHLPKSKSAASDFRYNVTSSAIVAVSDLLKEQKVVVKGGGS